MKIPKDNVKRFIAFINERHAIYERREAGAKRPWTKDPILRSYRFCNVYRELDTVTKWIARNWRDPHKGDPDMWFAMAVARYINWPPTLDDIGYPIPWRPSRVIQRIKTRRDDGQKVWTGAYMIGTQGNAVDKPVFIVEEILDKLWHNREWLRPQLGVSLHQFACRLNSQYAFKGFMTGQVIADAKYADPALRAAPDWWSFALSGPGSRRGLNRVMGNHPHDKWREDKWHDALCELSSMLPLKIATSGGRLHNQDVQNCLCEFDKYERTRLGEGRPRSTYAGA